MNEEQESLELLTEPMPEIYHENQEITIFKANPLITGCHDLSSHELNLLNLVIEKSRKTNCSKLVTLTAQEYANACKVDIQISYKILKALAIRLKRKSFKATIYKNNIQTVLGNDDLHTLSKPKNLGKTPIKDVEVVLESVWVQALFYPKNGGFISFALSDPLHYIVQKTSESYTKIPHSKSLELKGSYAKRLSELCYRWVDAEPLQGQDCVTVKKTVADWYDYFGCLGKYKLTAEFKRWVLEPAISEVNQQKIFDISYRQIKVGRVIREIELRIEPKEYSQKSTEQTELTPQTEKEYKVVADKHAYADKINATATHRKNLVNNGIKQERQAEQDQADEQKRQAQERADNESKEQKELEERLATYNRIKEDENLAKAFCECNKKAILEHPLNKQNYEKKDYKSVLNHFEADFKNAHAYQALDLSFLELKTKENTQEENKMSDEALLKLLAKLILESFEEKKTAKLLSENGVTLGSLIRALDRSLAGK